MATGFNRGHRLSDTSEKAVYPPPLRGGKHPRLSPAQIPGAAPINWALINGEKETGLTSFFLKKTVDTGDIILQEKTTIGDDENFDSLYNRLAEMAGPFTLKTVEAIESGEVSAAAQDDGLATGAPKISPFDALMDFGRPRKIELAALVDRGDHYRELPIQANYVGGVWDISEKETINVYLKEGGFEDHVAIEKKGFGNSA